VPSHQRSTPIEAIHTDLAAKELLPSEHYVDIGYIDAELLVRRQTDTK
jgi:transposase